MLFFFTRLLAAGGVSPCFWITSRTMVLRLLLPPPETPELTALSLPSAFTVSFDCVVSGGCPCILPKALRLSRAPPDAPSPCLRQVRFLAPAETPPAEAPAAETPAAETPAADWPSSTSILTFRLFTFPRTVAPIVGSYPRSATVTAAYPLPPYTSG